MGSFPWTYKLINSTLVAAVKATQRRLYNIFEEGRMERTLHLCFSKFGFNSDPTKGPVLTLNDLRAQISHQHRRYQRICEIAELPSCEGFSRREWILVMTNEQYARHIQVRHYSCNE